MKSVHETVLKIKIPGRFFSRTKYLGIRFDMLSFFRLMEEFGIGLGDDMSQISKIPPDDLISVAVYTGAESYCVYHRIPVWFNKDDVLEWINESIIKIKDMKEVGALWFDFMNDFNNAEGDEKKKEETP